MSPFPERPKQSTHCTLRGKQISEYEPLKRRGQYIVLFGVGDRACQHTIPCAGCAPLTPDTTVVLPAMINPCVLDVLKPIVVVAPVLASTNPLVVVALLVGRICVVDIAPRAVMTPVHTAPLGQQAT